MARNHSEERAGLFRSFASRLRYPQLFFAVALLFGLDLAIPDVIPFIDEILLALLTVLLGSLKERRKAPSVGSGSCEKDVTPGR